MSGIDWETILGDPDDLQRAYEEYVEDAQRIERKFRRIKDEPDDE